MTITVEPLLLLRNPDGSYALDLASIGIQPWQALPLFAPWAPLAGEPSARFYRDPLGIVRIAGFVTNGGGPPITNDIGQLPAGYRPDADVVIPCVSGSVLIPVLIHSATGVISPINACSDLFLDSISLRAA